MAKAKATEPAKETLVETVQDNDFEDRVDPVRESAPRGASLQSDIDAIRKDRARQRALHGKAGKKRVITNYQDAERLRNLGLLTAEEYVNCEEDGLFFDPAQYATGTSDAIDSEPPSGAPADEAG